jgi:hypothetical protein
MSSESSGRNWWKKIVIFIKDISGLAAVIILLLQYMWQHEPPISKSSQGKWIGSYYDANGYLKGRIRVEINKSSIKGATPVARCIRWMNSIDDSDACEPEDMKNAIWEKKGWSNKGITHEQMVFHDVGTATYYYHGDRRFVFECTRSTKP